MPKFGPDVFDLWLFHRKEGDPRYLLLHTSQEKADKWFGGGRFWQIMGDFLKENEKTQEGIDRHLDDLGLSAKSVWCCEFVYTIYNRRFDGIQIVPVFAAEVEEPGEIALTWEHSEQGWFTAEECLERINFWGLKEGLTKTREYVVDSPSIPAEFRLR